MNKETLSLPVGYTLISRPDGTFQAIWKPQVPTKGLPPTVSADSRTSGIHALERLYEALVEVGVVTI